jgi:hypothetical protein
MRKDFSATLSHLVDPLTVERFWDEATRESQHQFLFIDYSAEPSQMFRIGFDRPFSVAA